MKDSFTFHPGSMPLLVSVPHDGRNLPDDFASTMTAAGRAIPDTDWHVAKLYEFAQGLGAAVIKAEYSRYVVDLNRPADNASLYEGQVATGLCPQQTFDGQDIYTDATRIDVESRVDKFWKPYHEKIAETLSAFRQSHGFALLWDAHSIASRVPRLFDGELPVLNLGTWDGHSCRYCQRRHRNCRGQLFRYCRERPFSGRPYHTQLRPAGRKRARDTA